MVTLVTGFFDLGAREKNSKRLQASDYLCYGEKILALDVNLVCFIEPKFAEYIYEQRKKHGLLARTVVIPFLLENAKYYQYLNRIEANCHFFRQYNQDKLTPLYAVVCWTKFDLLERVMALNPFGDRHFGWIDFGLSHVVKIDPRQIEEDEVFTKPVDLVRVVNMRYFSLKETQNREVWASSIFAITAGGFFTGLARNLEKVCQLFEAYALDYLATGHPLLDENIMTIVFLRHPELFSISYGNYGSLIWNYRYLRIEAYRVVENMKRCLARDCISWCLDIGATSWRDYHAKKFEADLPEFLSICDNYMVALYRTNDKQKLREVATFYKSAIHSDPKLLEKFATQRHQDDFSYYGINLLDKVEDKPNPP